MPVPESSATLIEQQRQLLSGNRAVQMFPKGHPELPLPRGFQRLVVNGDVFHYDKSRVTPKEIIEASKAGRENELLDLGPVSKDDTAERVARGEQPLAVVERTPEGTETRAAAGTDMTAATQVAAMNDVRSPQNSVVVESPEETIAQRFAEGGDVDLPDGPWAAPSSDLPDAPWSAASTAKSTDYTGSLKAAAHGAAQGASFNLSDEMAGAHAAGPSWIPELVGPIPARTIAGGVRAGLGHLTGMDKEGVAAYEKGRDEERAALAEARKEHPYITGGSEIAGSLVVPGGAAASAASLPLRMGKTALAGAGMGALYGAGEGENAGERLSKAATGAATGAVFGAGAPVVASGLSKVVGAAGDLVGKIAGPMRGALDPEKEAARRVLTAIQKDMQTGGSKIGQEEAAMAAQTGQPLNIADLGGEKTRALARSSANTSPEARNILNDAIDPRFEGQGDRAVDFVRNLVSTPADATATRGALDDLAKTARSPFYKKAHADGAKGIWDDELAAIGNSATMKPILTEAAKSIEAKTLSGRAMNPISENGTPTLEYWDQVKRTLDSKINVAKRAGDKETVADLSAIRSRIIQKADDATKDANGVSSYAMARGVSHEIFKAGDALEAGEKFFTSTVKNPQARAAVGKMNPEEKALFAEGYASALVRKVDEIGERRNIVNAIFQNKAARERLEIAVGPQAAKDMEVFLRVENIMDGLRRSMGNSTTIRQMVEMGMAGGAYGITAGDAISPSNWVTGALLYKGARGAGKAFVNRVDQKTAQKVAEMLVSNDPAILRKGAAAAARNPRFVQALRNSDAQIAKVGALNSPNSGLLPAIQGTLPGRAQQDQQN